MQGGKEYLIWFIHEHHDFLIPEYRTLCEMNGVEAIFDSETFQPKISPFLKVRLPDDQTVKKIASRAILIRSIYEVWAEGTTYDDLKPLLLNSPLEKEYMERCDYTFEIIVETFGRKYSQSQKLDKMAAFSFMDILQGKVDLSAEEKDNKYIFSIIEDVGENPPAAAPPKRVYFTRRVAIGARHLIDRFDVKKREYIGTTSMDSALSLIIANMAKASTGSLILDPFAGTGSLLITCSHFGAKTMGCDLDPRILRGNKGNGKNVISNFKQYDVMRHFVDLLINDSSNHAVWRSFSLFDAIVADPPYGVRAGARKVGKKQKHIVRPKKPIPDVLLQPHIPSCVVYDIEELLFDLYTFAAKFLVVSGRLVFWLPTTNEYKDSDLPTHPCLELYSNSEQALTMKMRRRLITLVKTSEYIPDVHDSYEYTIVEKPAHSHFSAKYLHSSKRDGTITDDDDDDNNNNDNNNNGEDKKKRNKQGKRRRNNKKPEDQSSTTSDPPSPSPSPSPSSDE